MRAFISGYLIVMNVKMYESTNKVAHHTDAYKLSNLIIRRGQEFIMGIVFNRPFNPDVDLFFIEFLIGESLLWVYGWFGFNRLQFVGSSSEKDKVIIERTRRLQCKWIKHFCNQSQHG